LDPSPAALFVWLEATGLRGRFSENGFLQPEAVKNIVFFSKEFISQELLQESLTVRAYKPY
jgi:hypothetical protein